MTTANMRPVLDGGRGIFFSSTQTMTDKPIV
jgi:hypothetical protein